MHRKKITAHKDPPWINHDIKKAMKNQKKLYDHAKLIAGVFIIRSVTKLSINGTVPEFWTPHFWTVTSVLEIL